MWTCFINEEYNIRYDDVVLSHFSSECGLNTFFQENIDKVREKYGYDG